MFGCLGRAARRLWSRDVAQSRDRFREPAAAGQTHLLVETQLLPLLLLPLNNNSSSGSSGSNGKTKKNKNGRSSNSLSDRHGPRHRDRHRAVVAIAAAPHTRLVCLIIIIFL